MTMGMTRTFSKAVIDTAHEGYELVKRRCRATAGWVESRRLTAPNGSIRNRVSRHHLRGGSVRPLDRSGAPRPDGLETLRLSRQILAPNTTDCPDPCHHRLGTGNPQP